MMYKNDLKRDSLLKRNENSGADIPHIKQDQLRRGNISPTPFELMQMRAYPSKAADVPLPLTGSGPREQSGVEKETDHRSDSRELTSEKNGICEEKRRETGELLTKDELLIGALLAFLLFSDKDSDIVLIGILIYLLI